MRCCGRDRGCLALRRRPSGGFKSPTAAWLKTVVVNAVGRGAARSRQVWVGKMSDDESPPPLTCRKPERGRRNEGCFLALGWAWGAPGHCPGGVRLPLWVLPFAAGTPAALSWHAFTRSIDEPCSGSCCLYEFARSRVPSPGALADSPVVAMKRPRIAAEVERSGGVVLAGGRGQLSGEEPRHGSRLKIK